MTQPVAPLSRAASWSAVHTPRLLLWLFSALLALLVQWPAVAQARDVPTLAAHVNDTAGMLSPDERAQLEAQLVAYEHKTGRQFALLTIDSLNGDALEDFSIRVVEAWKLGQKGKDSGLLLLVVKDDHKLRVEVGYGLEGTVTDSVFVARDSQRAGACLARGPRGGRVRASLRRVDGSGRGRRSVGTAAAGDVERTTCRTELESVCLVRVTAVSGAIPDPGPLARCAERAGWWRWPLGRRLWRRWFRWGWLRWRRW